MIKLQALLAAHCGAPELERVRQWLVEHGVQVTGSGVRSLSAQADPDTFRRLFGALPDTAAGFAASLTTPSTVPVPEPLHDLVELLTLVPRHEHH